MTTSPPYAWLEKVETALSELDEKPQFQHKVPFPHAQLESVLQKLFQKPQLAMAYQEKGWVAPGDLFKGLGEHLSTLAIEWTPLTESLYFVAAEQDIKELMCDLLGGESVATPFFDPELSQGFFHYLALEILQGLEQVQFAHPLSPRLGESPKNVRQAIQEPCFVIDVSLALEEKTVWGRLLIPEPFRRMWNGQFAGAHVFRIDQESLSEIFIDVALVVGRAALPIHAFKEMGVGDFLLLDRCSYDPIEKKGAVTLTVSNHPIFRGRIKEHEIKLSEYPLFEEVVEPMEEEYEAQMGEEPLPEEEEFLTEEAPDEMPPAIEEGASHLEVAGLVVNMTVEVGRLQMSVQELMQLSPGNLLDLHVTPEQGVDLVVNGKKVGRGELIRMGEVLGVRLLSFAKK